MATEQANRLDVDEPLLVLPLPPKPSTYSTAEIEHLRQRGREMVIYAQKASNSQDKADNVLSRVSGSPAGGLTALSPATVSLPRWPGGRAFGIRWSGAETCASASPWVCRPSG